MEMAMEMEMAEEEVRQEVEAVQAVYGDDCCLLCEFPPHLTVHIKPRTADDSSQQFVEVTLGIKASLEYPENPPYIYIADMKGLDNVRETHLTTSISKRAQELSSCLMLVALCEEAVDLLTNMNHPEGDCPLCLYPLVAEDEPSGFLSYMKLMSCYHCFHSECILRWWRWIDEQKETNRTTESAPASAEIRNAQVLHSCMNQQKGNCPVCRKVFDAKDIEHVLEYLAANPSSVSSTKAVNDEEERVILQSEIEILRRQNFESILNLQQEKRGLIEPRKDLVILPGMYLPEAAEPPSTSAEIDLDPSTNQGLYHGIEFKGKQKSSERRRKGVFHGFKDHQGSNNQPRSKQWVKKFTSS